MSDYRPNDIEAKWQEHWARTRAFEVVEDRSKPKFYCLEMFAYPSGHAHVGHVRNYMIGDIMARTMRMRGFNVLHPFGWDAFGLPAENAAIKNNVHPETWTLDNIAHMKGQLQRLGISYAWERELATCLPDYYRWNQWLFTRMFQRGLAYRKRSTVNWCESCQTVLANEQVVDGGCWRCGTLVTLRDLEQWFLRITAYADELLDALESMDTWPEKVVTMQRNWIGRSEGARVRFDDIEVFTTRIDTIFGSTFVLIAPEHPLVERFAAGSADPEAFRARAAAFRGQDRTARMTGEVEKEGFDTGRTVTNPFTQQPVPVWVANFVLGDYGTGAVMGVPGHDQRDFEFARKYGLPIPIVVQPEGDTLSGETLAAAYDGPGTLVGSGAYTGLEAAEANRRMTGHRPGHGAVPAEGLGGLAAALLGHADSDRPLRRLRARARARRGSAGRAAEGRRVHRSRRLAAGAHPGVRQRRVPVVWPARPARDRHDGHVRRFVLVLLPVLRRPQRRSAVRPRQGRVLGARRLLQRRRRARDPAPDLLALLQPRVPRPRSGDDQRAVLAPPHAGHGAEERRCHVEVQGERRRSG
jgi:hypothetical protein